jgi:hypothetical protein
VFGGRGAFLRIVGCLPASLASIPLPSCDNRKCPDVANVSQEAKLARTEKLWFKSSENFSEEERSEQAQKDVKV